jgi:hypothetical protein
MVKNGNPVPEDKAMLIHLPNRIAVRLKVAAKACRLSEEDFIIEAIDAACVPRLVDEFLAFIEGKKIKEGGA